jgi:hypothetical protein
VCWEKQIGWAKDNNSKTDLAPSEQEHKEYISYLARRSGIPANAPREVLDCIKKGRIAVAVKILKREYPDLNFANLKGFVDMIISKSRGMS